MRIREWHEVAPAHLQGRPRTSTLVPPFLGQTLNPEPRNLHPKHSFHVLILKLVRVTLCFWPRRSSFGRDGPPMAQTVCQWPGRFFLFLFFFFSFSFFFPPFFPFPSFFSSPSFLFLPFFHSFSSVFVFFLLFLCSFALKCSKSVVFFGLNFVAISQKNML